MRANRIRSAAIAASIVFSFGAQAASMSAAPRVGSVGSPHMIGVARTPTTSRPTAVNPGVGSTTINPTVTSPNVGSTTSSNFGSTTSVNPSPGATTTLNTGETTNTLTGGANIPNLEPPTTGSANMQINCAPYAPSGCNKVQ